MFDSFLVTVFRDVNQGKNEHKTPSYGPDPIGSNEAVYDCRIFAAGAKDIVIGDGQQKGRTPN